MNRASELTESELDAVYTHFCNTMTRIGEAQSLMFLARFALLAMTRIGDSVVIQQLIDMAADKPNEV